MASVSVSGIEGTAGEIQGVNSILQSTATNASTTSDTISKLATEFASYNNQVVAENTPHTVGYKSINSVDYYEEYDTWVTTTGGLESRAASLASKAEEINSVVDRINSKVADVQTIAVAIQGYIDEVQGILGNWKFSSSATASALLALGRDGVAKANLATSGADINGRNFLDYDSIKDDEKLNGGLLSFEKQDDGSYLIKKDGESTGYYTTGLAAALYMKTLTTTTGKEYKTEINNFKDKVSDTVGNIKDKVTSFGKKNSASDKINLSKKDVSVFNANDSSNKKNTAYSNGKSIIDGLEQKEQYTYDSQRILDNKTVKLYKGKSGGYKLVESTSTGGSKVTYYSKNNDWLYIAEFNENDDFVNIVSGRE